MDECRKPGIQGVLAGLDEVTERFGDELLGNGITVGENNQAVLGLLAALSGEAAGPRDDGGTKTFLESPLRHVRVMRPWEHRDSEELCPPEGAPGAVGPLFSGG